MRVDFARQRCALPGPQRPAVLVAVLIARGPAAGLAPGRRSNPARRDNRMSALAQANAPDTLRCAPAMAVVTMKQLLDSGVHFGHQTRRWNPK
ncbi:MAG: hypothetical protein ACRDQI_13525, partial [Pseudonocardiaceae bacterium]